jgi:predicted double-glycine peptidase
MQKMALVLLAALSACDVGTPVSDRPKSILYLRYEATVPQLADFTCGAASLATVMTFYWNTPISEAKLLKSLKARYTDDQIKHINETGLNFDDMILMAKSVGFEGEGVKLPLNELPAVKGPIIVHLDKGELQHFVVLRRVGDGVYYVSDPIVGQLAMSKAEFAKQYTGDALTVWKEGNKLPDGTVLANPRDGINVDQTVNPMINEQQMHFTPSYGPAT